MHYLAKRYNGKEKIFLGLKNEGNQEHPSSLRTR
jgi:hypothetical protein